MDLWVETLEKALLSVDRPTARQVVENAKKTLSPVEITENLIAPALELIGEGWERGTVALSQVYMSGRICEDLVDDFLPPGSPNRKDQPHMGIAVLDDHHVLGKRIISAILRAAGFELLDLGTLDVSSLLIRTKEEKIEVLFISTLMLRSALLVKEVTTQLKAECAPVTVAVGGAPFRLDPQLWKEVGADAVGDTASDALRIAEKIMGGGS
jgi:methanogenic corrinoid protein MtbC1